MTAAVERTLQVALGAVEIAQFEHRSTEAESEVRHRALEAVAFAQLQTLCHRLPPQGPLVALHVHAADVVEAAHDRRVMAEIALDGDRARVKGDRVFVAALLLRDDAQVVQRGRLLDRYAVGASDRQRLLETRARLLPAPIAQWQLPALDRQAASARRSPQRSAASAPASASDRPTA